MGVATAAYDDSVSLKKPAESHEREDLDQQTRGPQSWGILKGPLFRALGVLGVVGQ